MTITPHRFSVEDYLRLAEIEVLPPDRRTELIEGEILDVSPQGLPHSSTALRVLDLLGERFRDSAIVGAEYPLALRSDSRPEPDLVLLRRRADFYADSAPSKEDVLLIVEIADTTLRFDRTIKARVYAKHGLRDYWIVDVNARVAIVHRDPSAGGYASVVTWSEGAMAPLAFADRPIDLRELFPHASVD